MLNLVRIVIDILEFFTVLPLQTSKLTEFLICLILCCLANRKYDHQSATRTNGQRDGDCGRTATIATTAAAAAATAPRRYNGAPTDARGVV